MQEEKTLPGSKSGAAFFSGLVQNRQTDQSSVSAALSVSSMFLPLTTIQPSR